MKLSYILGSLFVAALLALWPWGIEGDFNTLKASYHEANGTQTFYDRHGDVLHVEHKATGDQRQKWVDRKSLPNHLIENLLAIEDKRFYEHHGIDPLALGAALRDSLKFRKLRGASTLTMQLAGLLEKQGSRSRNIFQKLKQMSGALYLEARWSKEEILEAYVNQVSYRQNLVGIQAASLGLFQKEPHGLTREESLILSALLSSPNTSPERVSAKACLFTDKLSCETLKTLARQHLRSRARLPREAYSAPHFVRVLKSKDQEVRTTLDKRLQIKAQELIAAQMEILASQNVHDAAALVLDHRNGETLVYVGSSGSYSQAKDVDGVRALRQAGSTLKPLLYAKAFDEGLMTPETLLEDSPFSVQTPGGLYSPHNYDESFKGIIPAKLALASSLNIPAVRVIDLVTVDSFYQTLLSLGFTLASRQTYGHSLALGAADVSLSQLVRAYAVLARKGLDLNASLLKDQPLENKRIFKTETAEEIETILSSKDNRAETFGLDNALATPYPAAVKTGTSKDMRDNWCIGWDDRYVVGVWVGNAKGSPMWNVSGVSGAAPIWRALMDDLHESGDQKIVQRKVVPTLPSTESALRPLSRTLSQITYPLNRTLIAFDPDIPEENQALIPEHSSSQKLFWRLDDKPLDSSIIPLSALSPGPHQLTLIDKNQRVLDKVRFDLRGKSSVIAKSE